MTDLLLRALYRAAAHGADDKILGVIFHKQRNAVMDRDDNSKRVHNGTYAMFSKRMFDAAHSGEGVSVTLPHGETRKVSKWHITITKEVQSTKTYVRHDNMKGLVFLNVEVKEHVFVQTWLSENQGSQNVGVGIAGNSAKIGGGLTIDATGLLKPNWRTSGGGQEESVIRSWLEEEETLRQTPPQLTMNRVVNAWHLPTESEVVQPGDYDFVNEDDASIYAHTVTEKSCLIANVAVTLVFAAGPNCNPDTMRRTMRLTRNNKAVRDKAFFRECLLNAYYGTLCAMRDAGVEIALLPFLSSNIYVGPHNVWYTIDVAKSLVREAWNLVQDASFTRVIILY